ncbi:Uncharacterised protein [Mycobacteroides abscessus subsp. massiliense]|nr:Uncharacterised protein [Mycobacteroides abscessus subsp. massiliense]
MAPLLNDMAPDAPDTSRTAIHRHATFGPVGHKLLDQPKRLLNKFATTRIVLKLNEPDRFTGQKSN